MTGIEAAALAMGDQEVMSSLKEDQQEKRLLARAGKSRAPHSGSMRTPLDLLGRAAKQEYTKPSEVRTYRMEQKRVPMWDEFTALPVQEQVALLEDWRQSQTAEEISKALGISSSNYYYYLKHKLGYRQGEPPRLGVVSPAPVPAATPVPTPATPAATQAKHQGQREKGLVLSMRGAYEGKHLKQRLLALAGSLGSAGTAFEVSITLKEVSL